MYTCNQWTILPWKKSRPICYVKSPVAQDPFVSISGLISCTGWLGNNLDQLHINVLIILDVTTFTFFTSTQILWTMFLSNLRGHLGLQRRMKPSVSMLPSWMMMHLKIQRASWWLWHPLILFILPVVQLLCSSWTMTVTLIIFYWSRLFCRTKSVYSTFVLTICIMHLWHLAGRPSLRHLHLLCKRHYNWEIALELSLADTWTSHETLLSGLDLTQSEPVYRLLTPNLIS